MPLVTTKRDGNVLVVEVARPEKGNALSRAAQQELSKAWEEFEENDDLKVAVLHGAGGVFSIGHDVEELAKGQGASASPIPEAGIFPMSLQKPVIAAVEGPCYGLGFELALSCDLRIAAEGAKFGIPDLKLPVAYRVASVLLPRMTFMGLSIDLINTGRVLDAKQAQANRLVNKVVPKGQALAEATTAAKAMATRFADVNAAQKRQIWGLSGLPLPYAMSLARDTGPVARM